MMAYVFVGLGGVVGAILRYELGKFFPNYVETLLVNVVGCFCLSYISFKWISKTLVSTILKKSFCVGLIGSFTTYATFSFHLFELVHQGAFLYALLYGLISFIGGLGMIYVGFIMTRMNEHK